MKMALEDRKWGVRRTYVGTCKEAPRFTRGAPRPKGIRKLNLPHMWAPLSPLPHPSIYFRIFPSRIRRGTHSFHVRPPGKGEERGRKTEAKKSLFAAAAGCGSKLRSRADTQNSCFRRHAQFGAHIFEILGRRGGEASAQSEARRIPQIHGPLSLPPALNWQ